MIHYTGNDEMASHLIAKSSTIQLILQLIEPDANKRSSAEKALFEFDKAGKIVV